MSETPSTEKSISGNICGLCGGYKNVTYTGYTAEEVAPYICTC